MNNKFTYKHHSTLCCCMSQNSQTICCDGKFFMIKVYLFRSQENGNSLFLTFLIAMCGENRYVEDMRILTAIEPYLNSGFYNKHLNFISLVSKYTNVFSSIDAKLTISVWRSALDSNKTKGELVQNEATSVCTFFKWDRFLCVLDLTPVCSSSVQCYYKGTSSLLKYKLMFSQLTEPRWFNPFSNKKVYLLFCNNASESSIPFMHNNYVLLIICSHKKR